MTSRYGLVLELARKYNIPFEKIDNSIILQCPAFTIEVRIDGLLFFDINNPQTIEPLAPTRLHYLLRLSSLFLPVIKYEDTLLSRPCKCSKLLRVARKLIEQESHGLDIDIDLSVLYANKLFRRCYTIIDIPITGGKLQREIIWILKSIASYLRYLESRGVKVGILEIFALYEDTYFGTASTLAELKVNIYAGDRDHVYTIHLSFGQDCDVLLTAKVFKKRILEELYSLVRKLVLKGYCFCKILHVLKNDVDLMYTFYITDKYDKVLHWSSFSYSAYQVEEVVKRR